MSAFVDIQKEGHILNIWFNRPDKKNALTRDMYVAAGDAVEQATIDHTRVIVFRGRGNMFTAGNDLVDFQSGLGEGEPPVMRFLRLIRDFPSPIIVGVDGPAVGIGTTMLAHCDYVVAASGAKFAMPFVNLGLCPEAASSYLLPKVMGHTRAAELLLFGKTFTAQQAYDYGLIAQVVLSDELDAIVHAAALELAAKAPESIRISKAFLKAPDKDHVREIMAEEGRVFAERLASAECKEAISAFLERRKPDFSQFN